MLEAPGCLFCTSLPVRHLANLKVSRKSFFFNFRCQAFRNAILFGAKTYFQFTVVLFRRSKLSCVFCGLGRSSFSALCRHFCLCVLKRNSYFFLLVVPSNDTRICFPCEMNSSSNTVKHSSHLGNSRFLRACSAYGLLVHLA